MIASLQGKITYKTPALRKDAYIVVTCAGVGYKVYTPASSLKNVSEGEEVTVYTYLAVSERAMDLYGFLNPANKTFFTLLLEVPGIGPKKALDILDKASMADVQQAIVDDSPEMLVKTSGLTQKTAEKIIVALKDKVESLSGRPADEKGQTLKNSDVEAFDALVGFGYSAAEAKQALQHVDSDITDTAQRIKEALKSLGKR